MVRQGGQQSRCSMLQVAATGENWWEIINWTNSETLHSMGEMKANILVIDNPPGKLQNTWMISRLRRTWRCLLTGKSMNIWKYYMYIFGHFIPWKYRTLTNEWVFQFRIPVWKDILMLGSCCQRTSNNCWKTEWRPSTTWHRCQCVFKQCKRNHKLSN